MKPLPALSALAAAAALVALVPLVRRWRDPVAGGEWRMARGDLAGARAIWDHACLAEPGSAAACVSSGTSRLMNGEAGDAESFARRAESLAPDDLRVLLLRAGLERAAGHDQEARRRYEQAQARYPASGLPAANLGWLAMEQGNVREAEGLADKALAAQPDLPLALSLRGRVLAATHQLEPAEELYRKLVATGKASAEDRAALADVLGEKGDLPGRIDALEAAIRERPGDPRLLTAYAQSLSQADRWDEAVAAMRQVVDLEPALPQPQRLLGELYLSGERYDFAESRFQAALALSSNDEPSRYDLAVALAEEKRYREAIGELDRVLADSELAQEARVHALHDRALCRVRLGEEVPAAMADLRAILALDPGNIGAHWMKGHLLLEAGKTGDAEPELAKATASDPAPWEALLDHARALAARARPDEAVAELARLARQGELQPAQVRAQPELAALTGNRVFQLLLAGADPQSLVATSSGGAAGKPGILRRR